jgi:hypothetical protein
MSPMAGRQIPDEIPESGIETAEREAGYEVPVTLSEPPTGLGNASAVERVVDRVKARIFPAPGC